MNDAAMRDQRGPGWRSAMITGAFLFLGWFVVGLGLGQAVLPPEAGVLVGTGAGLLSIGVLHWSRARQGTRPSGPMGSHTRFGESDAS